MNHQPQRTKVTAAITAPLLKRKRTLCEKASSLQSNTVKQKKKKLQSIQPYAL